MPLAREQPEWASDAESYQAWYGTPRGQRYDTLEKGLLSQLLPPAKGRHLLDIGCGTGHFTRWLDQLGWQVWGLDAEERMLAWARKHSGNRIVYCQGNAEALPFGDHSFDICTMLTTLEAIAHPQVALAETFRVSREEILLGILNSMSVLALSRRIKAFFRPTIFSRTRFYSGPGLFAMISRVARHCDLSVSLKLASQRTFPVVDVPRGVFFAVSVKLKK